MSTELRYVLKYSKRILGEAAAYDFLLRNVCFSQRTTVEKPSFQSVTLGDAAGAVEGVRKRAGKKNEQRP